MKSVWYCWNLQKKRISQLSTAVPIVNKKNCQAQNNSGIKKSESPLTLIYGLAVCLCVHVCKRGTMSVSHRWRAPCSHNVLLALSVMMSHQTHFAVISVMIMICLFFQRLSIWLPGFRTSNWADKHWHRPAPTSIHPHPPQPLGVSPTFPLTFMGVYFPYQEEMSWAFGKCHTFTGLIFLTFPAVVLQNTKNICS